MKFSTIVQRHRADIAFIVGNGINRFRARSENSWHALLVALWNRHRTSRRQRIPHDIALTEFFDLVALDPGTRSPGSSLQREFCELMREWTPAPHHRRLVAWAIDNGTPILTTNFENNLGSAGDCSLHHMPDQKFTDFYPWRSYFSTGQVSSPGSEFAIWHVNGMERYHRSIRLGLTHYMGSVSRARTWIHGRGSKGLFAADDLEGWRGSKSWLQVVFTSPLAVFGLGLDPNEIFLRWLLIERARFFHRFSHRRQPAWFVFAGQELGPGKRLFLESLGVTPVRVGSYEEIYLEPWD